MLNIEIPKVRPSHARRGELIEWRTGESLRERSPGDRPDTDVATDVEQRWFAMAVSPWLSPDARVLEIGPGSGKWTVRMAPLVRELVVVDVDETMLDRTRARLQNGEIRNVSFVLGSGRDLRPLPPDRFDLVFGYDVFVQISLEDTISYLADIARVLRDGGLAVLHHAVNDVRPAWDRIEAQGEGPRAAETAPFHYHSREALDRMYARFGLRVESVWTDDCTMVVTARRPDDSIVPRLEQALRLAATADDDGALDDALRALTAVGRELNDRLAPLATALLATAPGPDRFEVIQRIRRLIRG